jgi:hypothetical protein
MADLNEQCLYKIMLEMRKNATESFSMLNIAFGGQTGEELKFLGGFPSSKVV